MKVVSSRGRGGGELGLLNAGSLESEAQQQSGQWWKARHPGLMRDPACDGESEEDFGIFHLADENRFNKCMV